MLRNELFLLFVPVDDVVTEFDLVAQQLDDDLIDYFEKLGLVRENVGVCFSQLSGHCIFFNLFRSRSKESSL